MNKLEEFCIGNLFQIDFTLLQQTIEEQNNGLRFRIKVGNGTIASKGDFTCGTNDVKIYLDNQENVSAFDNGYYKIYYINEQIIYNFIKW